MIPQITEVHEVSEYGPHVFSWQNINKCVLCGMPATGGDCFMNEMYQTIIGEGFTDASCFRLEDTFQLDYGGQKFVCQPYESRMSDDGEPFVRFKFRAIEQIWDESDTTSNETSQT